MKEKIYYIVYFSNMIFWTLRVFKNLSSDYEKEKHADVYESHMRMYRRVVILEFIENWQLSYTDIKIIEQLALEI